MTNNKRAYFQIRGKEEYFKKKGNENVRARSYFKLEQLNHKYKLLKNNIKILDLGCAPGGWLELMDKKLEDAQIYGIDLLRVKDKQEFSSKVKIFQDDFNNLDEYVDFEFDLILSDMAPEFSGKNSLDKGRTHKINLQTIDYSLKHLRVGGNLAFKTFEGEDLPMVRKHAKKFFEEVKEFKPRSSQKKSAETFVVCFNKLKIEEE